MKHPITSPPTENGKRPEYLICSSCNNRLKEGNEYFYLYGPLFGTNEVIGKCSKCKRTFNRVLY